jgi:tRNA pseudouridine38-40 synthase
MPRYFLEVAYKGTTYAGFQIQENANTIQAEVEKGLLVYFRVPLILTGSSRTDAGVHAFQNFFHFDAKFQIEATAVTKAIYHLNAILPLDIVIKGIIEVKDAAHCRFDALTRSYVYSIYNHKNPFMFDNAYYYPYHLDLTALQDAALLLLSHTEYRSFAKKNTQVFTYKCNILESNWVLKDDVLIYNVTGNRFLRGMVRGLVSTMLLVGKGKYSIADFKCILESDNSAKTDFSAPAKGLTLLNVKFPPAI